MLDLAGKATGADKEVADDRGRQHALRPDPRPAPTASAPWCSAARTSTSSSPEYVDGGKSTSRPPRRSSASGRAPNGRLKLAWVGSNPGNLNGFKTKWMKERLDTIKFLDVTTSMLPNGIPFPALPQAPEIMNIIVPDMLQNALTGTMTVDEAADDAATEGRRADGRRRL